jgi:hypothetical protein
MAGEAQRRGYDKDPEALRVMKQQMISKFLQKDFARCSSASSTTSSSCSRPPT